MKRIIFILLSIVPAAQLSAATYCPNISASTVECVGNIDCSTLTLGPDDYCGINYPDVTGEVVFLTGSAASELLRSLGLQSVDRAVAAPIGRAVTVPMQGLTDGAASAVITMPAIDN